MSFPSDTANKASSFFFRYVFAEVFLAAALVRRETWSFFFYVGVLLLLAVNACHGLCGRHVNFLLTLTLVLVSGILCIVGTVLHYGFPVPF